MSRRLIVKEGVRCYVSADFNRSIIFIEPFEADIGMDTDENRAFRLFLIAKKFGAKMALRGWKVVGCRRPGPREVERPGLLCPRGSVVVDLLNADEEAANGVFAVRSLKTVSYYAFFFIDHNDLGGSAYQVWLLGSTISYDVRFSLSPPIATCDCQSFHAQSWCNHLSGISALALNGIIHVESPIRSRQVLEAVNAI